MPHGTWTTTGGGGDSGSGVAMAAIAAVALIFGGGAAAALVTAVTELLIVIAVIIAVVVIAAAALLVWWLLKGQPAGVAKAEAARLARARVFELEQAKRDALRHQKALEVVAAAHPAPQVHIVNTIDPAAILAAAFGGTAWQQPQSQPVPVFRAEVEQ